MKTLIIALVLACLPALASSQSLEEYERQFNEEYAWRIQQTRLDGVYIPKDLEDAFAELDRLSDAEGLEKFKLASEEVIADRLHFGLGKWISANWSFYQGSRFSHYLKELGITHPDDMTQFVIVSWHRRLNGRDLETEARIEVYREKRKSILENRIHRDTLGR